MNIMTFCTPVSVSSPKLWALSFYHGTLTKDSFLGCRSDSNENINDNDNDNDNDTIGEVRKIISDGCGNCSTGVLQLLTFDHRYLVPILGKKSGRDVDKSIACREEGFPWWRIPLSSSGDGDGDADADGGDCSSSMDIDFELLPGCDLYIQVKCRSSTSSIDAGDHVVAICEVTRTGVWQQQEDEDRHGGSVRWLDEVDDSTAVSLPLRGFDETNALYSGQLREEGIL